MATQGSPDQGSGALAHQLRRKVGADPQIQAAGTHHLTISVLAEAQQGSHHRKAGHAGCRSARDVCNTASFVCRRPVNQLLPCIPGRQRGGFKAGCAWSRCQAA